MQEAAGQRLQDQQCRQGQQLLQVRAQARLVLLRCEVQAELLEAGLCLASECAGGPRNLEPGVGVLDACS